MLTQYTLFFLMIIFIDIIFVRCMFRLHSLFFISNFELHVMSSVYNLFVAGTSNYEEFVTEHAPVKPGSCEEELAACKFRLQESSASLREANGRISGSFVLLKLILILKI